MRPLPAFALMLALATPLAALAGQPSEPVPGNGIGLSDRALGAAAHVSPGGGSLRPYGMRLEYGRIRSGGSGIRVSRMADNAFGPAGDESARRIGQATEVAAPGRR